MGTDRQGVSVPVTAIETAYETVSGRAHLADPHLPEPRHDWVLDPWGWSVNTLCGLVLRRTRPVEDTAILCRKCAHKAVQART